MSAGPSPDPSNIQDRITHLSELQPCRNAYLRVCSCVYVCVRVCVCWVQQVPFSSTARSDTCALRRYSTLAANSSGSDTHTTITTHPQLFVPGECNAPQRPQVHLHSQPKIVRTGDGQIPRVPITLKKDLGEFVEKQLCPESRSGICAGRAKNAGSLTPSFHDVIALDCATPHGRARHGQQSGLQQTGCAWQACRSNVFHTA